METLEEMKSILRRKVHERPADHGDLADVLVRFLDDLSFGRYASSRATQEAASELAYLARVALLSGSGRAINITMSDPPPGGGKKVNAEGGVNRLIMEGSR